VVAGMDVVDKIKAVKTTTKAGHRDVPIEPVMIEKASVI
jgi:peptidyl-prolyl cis-trans isomerase B (cyclophilin B)